MRASFWAGGAAPAVDAASNLYVVSGNGSFDYSSGGGDLGESYVKLSTSGGLAVADYFTPFNYADLDNHDLDTGSAGVALLGDEAGSPAHPHLMAGAGKEGRIYLLDRDNLGKFHSGSDSQIVQSIPGGVASLFGNPAYFNRTLYFCGGGDVMRSFPVSNAQMPAKPASITAVTFGYPGCVPTVSANGTAGGIVWALDQAGVLRAYDAGNLASELYDSNQNKSRDALGATVKFSVPMVANGKVYAGTQSALVVYGGLPGTASLTVSNAAGGGANALAPGSLASLYGSGLPASPSITVNGAAAPVLYASSTQVNFQIPFETAVGPATVSLMANSAVFGTASATIQNVAPGLFLEAAGAAAVLNQDNSLNGPNRPAAVGDTMAAFLTGLGAVDPPVATGAAAPALSLSTTNAVVTATIGNVPASVQFSGLAPGFVGLYQVNVTIPQLAAGQYPLVVSAGGTSSNAGMVSVR